MIDVKEGEIGTLQARDESIGKNRRRGWGVWGKGMAGRFFSCSGFVLLL